MSIADEQPREYPMEGVMLPEQEAPDELTMSAASAQRPRRVWSRFGGLKARAWLARRQEGRRWIIGSVIAAILISLIAVGVLRLRGGNYTQERVTRGDVAQTVQTTGVISAITYHLTFPDSGQLATLPVQIGQHVIAGQTLATLNATSQQDALNIARTQAQAAQGAVSDAQATLQSARDNQSATNTQAQTMYHNAIVAARGDPGRVRAAQAQLDQALVQVNAQVEAAQAQLSNAQAQLNIAQAQATAAQHALARVILTAPVAGVIAAVHNNPGEVVGGNAAGAQSVIDLVDLRHLHIMGSVAEADVSDIQADQAVTFTVSTQPGATFSGAVAGVSPEGQAGPHGPLFPVSITVDAASAGTGKLYIGMQAVATIITHTASQAVLIPNSALRYARDAARNHRISTAMAQQAMQRAQQMIDVATGDVVQGQASYVLVLRQGKLVAVPVVIGITDGRKTVALAGVDVGAQVVTGDGG